MRLTERPPADASEQGAWLFTVATNVVRAGGLTRACRERLLAGAPAADTVIDLARRREVVVPLGARTR